VDLHIHQAASNALQTNPLSYITLHNMTLKLIIWTICLHQLDAVFENTYFTFFSDLKKNMTFYVFLKWCIKKS